MNYRKIYEQHYGPIPRDDLGRSHEIHHIDGDRNNNDISNLKCVSMQEHYDIHFSQGDFRACLRIGNKMKMSNELMSKLATMENKRRVEDRTHHWLGGEHQRQLAKKLVNEGRHHFLGGRIQTANHIKRVEDGTHQFLGGQIARQTQLNRVKNGTHNFLNGEISKRTNKERMKNGTHPTQFQRTCPHCNKRGQAPAMSRWHFDKCKSAPK